MCQRRDSLNVVGRFVGYFLIFVLGMRQGVSGAFRQTTLTSHPPLRALASLLANAWVCGGYAVQVSGDSSQAHRFCSKDLSFIGVSSSLGYAAEVSGVYIYSFGSLFFVDFRAGYLAGVSGVCIYIYILEWTRVFHTRSKANMG